MPDHMDPPYTLQQLGYAFNEAGELRTIDGGLRFAFTTQEAYERVGQAITHEVYNLMEKAGLERHVLKPKNSTEPDDLYSFFFASPGFQKKKTLLILIHGMGVVRAGQWSRGRILSEGLEVGSQLPYIERAMSNDWGVVVANTNLNEHYFDSPNEPLHLLKLSQSHEFHIRALWLRFIKHAKATEIFVVAHGRGGHDINWIIDEFHWENRVSCICITDFYFQFDEYRDQQPLVINWAAKDKSAMHRPALDPNRALNQLDVYQIWAGTSEHERSPYCAMDSIFYVLESPLKSSFSRLDDMLKEAWDIVVDCIEGGENEEEEEEENEGEDEQEDEGEDEQEEEGEDEQEEKDASQDEVEIGEPSPKMPRLEQPE